MKKRAFTLEDTNPMSWPEFGEILDTLTNKLLQYQKKSGIKFDIVAPILRSGGIPASAISIRFQITRFLPIQVKYLYDDNDPTKTELRQVLSVPELLQEIPSNPRILVCETNTGSGASAQKAFKIIRNSIKDPILYYATVAQVYGGPNSFDGVEEYFWGTRTNESFEASEDEAKKLNLRTGITIFPWERAEDELKAINS